MRNSGDDTDVTSYMFPSGCTSSADAASKYRLEVISM